MLRIEDLQRTSFSENELNTLNLLPTYQIKNLKTPKELVTCLNLLNTAQSRLEFEKSKIKNTSSQLKAAQRVSAEIQIVRLEQKKYRIRTYSTTILSHLVFNKKARILELYSLSSTPELFNFAKVEFEENVFFVQLPMKYLKQFTLPTACVFNSNIHMQTQSKKAQDITENEAIQICSVFHKGILNLRAKNKHKNQKIHTHNTIVKKLSILRSGNKIKVTK